MTRFARLKAWLAGAAIGIAIVGHVPAPLWPQEPASPARLAAILEKAAYYCWRLDRAAIDFVCREEVSEMTNRFRRTFSSFLYDFQFVRKKDEVKEQRTI